MKMSLLLCLDLFYTVQNFLLAISYSPPVSYNDVYVDDHFQMEMVVNVKRMRMRCKHVDDVSLNTYIHKYSDFLVAMISVGLAQARPNYSTCTVLYFRTTLCTIYYTIIVADHVIS